MARGKFITIEGIEGAGKSTAVTYIKNYLSKAQIDAVWIREPGGTELAEDIRAMILHPKNSETITPETELLLLFAARAQLIHHKIAPALHSGKWVVSDRFIDATYAYQGGGRGLNENDIARLDRWIVGNLYPDLTFLLDIPPEQGFERAAKRGLEKDRIENEEIKFFARVRDKYLERGQKDPQRIKLIDARKSPSEVEQQLYEALDAFRARGER